MNQISGGDQTIIRYLLNELSAEDQARFEEAYLSDGGLFEQVRALEEELIENYVKGDLSGRERRRFERHYLASDQRRARIEAARELVRACSPKSSTKTATDDNIWSKFFSPLSHLRSLANLRPAQVFGAATALLLLVVGGLVIELLWLRGQLTTVGAEFAAVERRAEESERRLLHGREQLAKERKQSVELLDKIENLAIRLKRSVREQTGSQAPKYHFVPMAGGREQLVELPEKLENLYRLLAQLELAQAESQAPKDQIVFLALAPGVRSIINTDRAVIYPNTSFVELRLELEERESTPPRS